MRLSACRPGYVPRDAADDEQRAAGGGLLGDGGRRGERPADPRRAHGPQCSQRQPRSVRRWNKYERNEGLLFASGILLFLLALTCSTCSLPSSSRGGGAAAAARSPVARGRAWRCARRSTPFPLQQPELHQRPHHRGSGRRTADACCSPIFCARRSPSARATGFHRRRARADRSLPRHRAGALRPAPPGRAARGRRRPPCAAFRRCSCSRSSRTRHAWIAGLIDGGVIRLDVARRNDRLSIAIENPRDADAPASTRRGVGLENVRQRLVAMFGAGRAARNTDRSGAVPGRAGLPRFNG